MLARRWRLAEALTPVERPGDYNQAMMDLGATVCTRANPDCESCPRVTDCRAHAASQATAYPYPKPRQVLPSRAAWFLILHNPQGEVLLERRPPTGIWGGLWSLPECPITENPLDWCRAHLSVEAELVEKLPARRHTFSHFRLEITPLRLRLTQWPERVAESDGLIWHTPGVALAVGLPAPVDRLLREIGGAGIASARTQ